MQKPKPPELSQKEINRQIDESVAARKKRRAAEMTERMIGISLEILIHRDVDVEKSFDLARDHVYRAELERSS